MLLFRLKIGASWAVRLLTKFIEFIIFILLKKMESDKLNLSGCIFYCLKKINGGICFAIVDK